MAGSTRSTGALAGMIAALCCAVLVLVASGRGLMGGRGPTTVLEAICGPGGCRAIGSAAPAHKGLDLHAAQQSLAQLHLGRHQQKKWSALDPRVWRHALVQSAALGNKQRRVALDEDDDNDNDDDEEDFDLGACRLPDFTDPNMDPQTASDLLKKIENGEVFCCPSDGQWKQRGADCADPEEVDEAPPPPSASPTSSSPASPASPPAAAQKNPCPPGQGFDWCQPSDTNVPVPWHEADQVVTRPAGEGTTW
jgi:hypothetical protein